jgi:hypothetical protein
MPLIMSLKFTKKKLRGNVSDFRVSLIRPWVGSSLFVTNNFHVFPQYPPGDNSAAEQPTTATFTILSHSSFVSYTTIRNTHLPSCCQNDKSNDVSGEKMRRSVRRKKCDLYVALNVRRRMLIDFSRSFGFFEVLRKRTDLMARDKLIVRSANLSSLPCVGQ